MNDCDRRFLDAFENCTLPFEQWKHRAHVRVAYLYLRRHPFDEAIHKVRAAIQRYNAATNTPETLNRGYHETITQAWMRLVHFALVTNGEADSSEAFLERHPELCSPKAVNRFYSQKHLISWKAKSEFVEPDLTRLPVPDHRTAT